VSELKLSQAHILGIDALRGIAALGVLLSHSVVVVLRTQFGLDTASYPEPWRSLHPTLGLAFGVYWVWLFFIISGFCIHLSISRSLQRGGLDLWQYAKARFTRIYPLFLLGLALTLIGWQLTDGWHTGEPLPLAKAAGSLCMTQLITGTLLGFEASWSLTSEAAYYAAWPLQLACFRWQSKRAYLPAVVISLLWSAVFYFLWHELTERTPRHWLIPFWTAPLLFLLWLGGAVLWDHWERFGNSRPWQAMAGALWSACGLGMLAYLYAHDGKLYLQLATALGTLPGIMKLIAGLHHLRLDTKPLAKSAAQYLGHLSYPCYILHHPILWMLQYLLLAPMKLPIWLNIAAAAGVSWVVVGTAGVWMERRLQAWRGGVLRIKP
jgi:peptidoglycan/LPS O-acetylase OafA/YrhL